MSVVLYVVSGSLVLTDLYISVYSLVTHYNNYSMSVPNWDMFKPAFSHGTFQWISVTDGKIPEGAGHIGIDKDRTVLYAGRANHEGDLLPAKISCSPSRPDFFFAYVSYNGVEYKKDTFEVLVSNDIAWQNPKNGEMPDKALPIGRTSEEETLYFGRTFHDGTLTPGKVHPSHKCLYFPYGDKEISTKDFEVMILL